MTYEQAMALARRLASEGRVDDARRVAQAAVELRLQGDAVAPFQPDGTPNPAFAETPAYERASGGGEAILRGTANGATFGFADNILGGMAVVSGRSPDGSGYLDYSDPGASYTAMRDLAREDLARDAETQPLASGVGNVVGGTAASIAAMPSVAGGGLLSQAGRMIGYGAAEGAAYGAGTGNGETWGEVAEDAGWGGVQGGLFGAVAPAAYGAVRGVGDMFAGGFNYLRGTPYVSRAGRVVSRAMDRAQKTLPDIEAALAAARADGQGDFLVADALEKPGQLLASGIASQPGSGGAALTRVLEERSLNQGNRVAGYLGDALGTSGQTRRQAQAAAEAARRGEATPNYAGAEANAGPVDLQPVLSSIDSRLAAPPRPGIAPSRIDTLLRDFRGRLAAPAPGVGPAFQLDDFRSVLNVKTELNDAINAAVRAGNNGEAAALMPIKNALDAALEEASTGYRRANDTFRAQSEAIDALDGGRAAAVPGRVQDAVDSYNALRAGPYVPPPLPGQLGPVAPAPLSDPREMFRLGFEDRVLGRIESVPTTNNALRGLVDPKARELVPVMAADAGDPDLWRRRLDREVTMQETQGRTLGNSITAERTAAQADVNADGAGVVEAAGLALNAATGNVVELSRYLGRRAASIGKGVTEQTRDLMARALMSNDTAELQRLLTSGQLSAEQSRRAAALLRHLGYQGVDALVRE